jgi:hypothetical protein
VETVTADFHGDDPVISFNPHYLLDGLAAAAVSAAPGPAAASASASAGAAGSQGPSGTPGTAHAGETADEGGAAASPAGPGRIRLEFTSPVKPAVITGLPATADAADDAGGEGSAGGADEAAAPDFRYLVVPLRVPVRQ